MSADEQICFATRAGKRRDFPGRVLPAMRKAVLNALRDPGQREALERWVARNVRGEDRGVAYLEAIHNAAWAGLYVPTDRRECDVVRVARPITVTLAHGGDCDQWAVVIAAALKLRGYRPHLFGFGDTSDPWLHVAVGAKYRGAWFLLDAKGSQEALPFNVWPDEPRKEAAL